MSTNQTKKCSKCGKIKSLEEFHKCKKEPCGHKSRCKTCRHQDNIDNRKYLSEYNKKYREVNKEKIRESSAKRYKNNSKYYKEKSKKYRKDNPSYTKKQYEYQKKRKKIDFTYKLTCDLRSTISSRIKANNGKKEYKTIELLGCTIKEARKHIELQFQYGMSWDNHGINGWHIDHIRPCASFDLSDPKQQKECFHYTNLQPLWAKDNLSKGDKWHNSSEK